MVEVKPRYTFKLPNKANRTADNNCQIGEKFAN